jgi:diaminohydroxyphosphoribosylaminopyrimidine deaminase/5-amino-6-(5-phosphoribosylamino)uracil reductase
LNPAGFLVLALDLARRARPSPNPPVGAVVVRGGRVVGRGFHRAAGEPHAEVLALREAGPAAKGADLWLTLEPCNHHGRTPPCTDAIVAAGVRRVLFGTRDPNPNVRGGGARRLRAAGLDVTDLADAACAELIAPFAKFARSGRPFVTVKVGASLDGRIAARTGRSRWITGPAAREAVQRMRARHDAILVGQGTLQLDDPRLTVRLPRGEFVSPQPVRLVLVHDPRALPRRRRAFGRPGGETWLLVPRAAATAAARRFPDVRVVSVPAAKGGWIDERQLLVELGRRGILSLLVEGGGQVFTRFLAAGLADRVVVFLAPKLLGGPAERGWFRHPGVDDPAQGWGLELLRVERYGDDLAWIGRPG